MCAASSGPIPGVLLDQGIHMIQLHFIILAINIHLGCNKYSVILKKHYENILKIMQSKISLHDLHIIYFNLQKKKFISDVLPYYKYE